MIQIVIQYDPNTNNVQVQCPGGPNGDPHMGMFYAAVGAAADALREKKAKQKADGPGIVLAQTNGRIPGLKG